MKTINQFFLVIGILIITSCTDHKKEEAEMQERLKAIEAIDSTVEDINMQIDTDMKELEAALEELDSL